VRNFQDGQWDPDLIQNIDAKTFKDTYVEKMDGCYACSVRCKKRVRDDAMGVLPKYGGPEYETIGAVGTNLTISDSQMVMLLNSAGQGTVVGNSTVYFIQAPGAPQVCQAKTPLTYQNIAVYRISAGGTFNVATWTGTGGTSYTISANVGVLSSTQAGGDIY
jgi:hypothetical protein